MSGSIETRMEQAMQHQRTGNLHEAAALYASILNQEQGLSVARHNLGMVRLALGDIADALELLERSILEDDANPGWRQSLPDIGMALYQQGLWEDARTWLQRAVLSGTKDARIHTAFHRVAPRDYLEPEVFDAKLGRALRRYAARASATYVYAIDVMDSRGPLCPTGPAGDSHEDGRTTGFIEVSLFRQIVAKIRSDNVAETPEVWLCNWGELPLHPHIGGLIQILHDAGLPSRLAAHLNNENARREMARLRVRKSVLLDCELRFNQTAINSDGSVALCRGVYEEASMLGAHFLEHGHRELEAMKYAHPTCKTCFGQGLACVPNDSYRPNEPSA